MTDAAPETAAPAETAPVSAPAATGNQTNATVAVQAVQEQPQAATPTTEAKAAEQKPATQLDYKIPEAYKDKPWAAKVKSEDDLWKQLENAQTLIGKKTVAPIDFKTATPEQIEEHLSATRPESKDVYQFGEGVDAEFTGQVGDIFLKNGITEYQGNKIIEAYQGLENQRLEQALSADGFKEVMQKGFGDKYEDDVKAVVNGMEPHMTPEDKLIMENTPNEYLGMVYRIVRNMQKAYGATENPNAHLGEQGTGSNQDMTAVRADLRAQLHSLSAKPHSQAEKDALINKLNDTYKTATQRK